jgi:Domain of unknown function (DUF5671)
MHRDLYDYIKLARSEHATDEQIQGLLTTAGWSEAQVSEAMTARPFLPAAPIPGGKTTNAAGLAGSGSAQPIAVVSNWTTRGLEYMIMFIALGVAATSLGWVLHNFVDSGLGLTGTMFEEGVSFASASLVVTLPIFAVLFLRLKKGELRDPSLRQDSSRKRMTQLTLLITFLIGLTHIVGYIYSLLNPSTANISPLGSLAHMLITVLIAGGIFTYYWMDEHRREAE